jgi:hypothetical protein
MADAIIPEVPEDQEPAEWQKYIQHYGGYFN